MKVEMGIGRGIGAAPSMGAGRIGSPGIGVRPMGFSGIEGPKNMMSMGARTLAKAWSPFFAPRESRVTSFLGRKPMDNIQIRSTIQRRLQGARYQGAPEVTTNKGISPIQIEPAIAPNIQRISTPEKRAMRVLSLVGSRMPFAVSRENPATTLNLVKKKTEAPKGMEVVFPTQPRPKPEIKLGQVTNPATVPVVSTETAQALKTVLALKKAGMTEQARKVAQNIKPEQRNISQVARVVDSIIEEKVKNSVKVKKVRKENEENTDLQKDLKKFRLVRDEKAFRARVEIMIKAVKGLFVRRSMVTGRELLSTVPSGNADKTLKSEVVRESERSDHTWETYVPYDLKEQKFESESQALEAIGVSLERHEPVTIAEDGKKMGVDALKKVYDSEQDRIFRPVSGADADEIIFRTEQVQRSQKETIWVDDEVVSQTSSTEKAERVEEPKAKIDLVALGIMPDLKELLKTAA